MSIEIIDLTFSYGERRILDHVSLSIQPGEVLAILGPNGAGKTTTLNAIAGLLSGYSGEILYDGEKRSSLSPRALALLVGYVPQTVASTFDYSVLEYVVTGCAPYIGTFSKPTEEHYRIAQKAMEHMGIAHLKEKSYCRISGGERQQAAIARVIAQHPRYIFLDEPTSHLDYGNQIRVLKTIRTLQQEGYGVVFTTHNPDHVLLLDAKVAVLNREGVLRMGGKEVITAPFLSALYGTTLCVSVPEGTRRAVCFSPDL